MLNQAVRICRIRIGEISTTTDAKINNAINEVKALFGANNIDAIRLKQELQAIYSTQVDTFRILVGRERRQPWLKDFKANEQSEWKFWKRYKEYLENKGFAPRIIENLDSLTDKILDNMFNPKINDIQLSKKGLVVGQVQSGKTANYTGLICKAADAGFNFIIVLAGIHNNLRSQTQARLDEGFLGFDTQFERVYANNAQNKIGVGRSTQYPNLVAHSITTSEEKGDFTKRAAGIVNFNTSDPILLVIKKNVSVLKRLYTWLKTQSNDSKINSKSVLVIDDEADNASINTNKSDMDPTKINGLIRDITNIFNRNVYVGYTATPFANIFIAQDDTDLFPRDFIINLPAPSNYIGPDKVFGTTLIPDESNDDILPIVSKVSDYSNFVPEGHKKDGRKPSFDDIPESLKTAIKCFIVTCAIRIARGQVNKHNSMLIHLSRYQIWQNSIKELIEQLFRFYKQEIEANDPAMLEEFRHIFEEDTDNYTSYTSTTKKILNSSLATIDNNMQIHTWEEIKPLLNRAAQKIIVKSINGSSGDVIDYQQNDKTGISVIAIGGDKLSRGLTLEGLSVSYFLRASKMYDTLMQMGRWFGYRPGYVDLCRLFTSPELNEWFRHITLASEELRDEFNYLAESGQTPEQYALKVRQHDGVLQITAINKMRNTKQIEVSWAGKLRETYQLPMDKGLKQRNLIATQELINSLGMPEPKENNSGNYLWRNVSPESICTYFTAFNVAKSLKKVNLDLICDYIKNLVQQGELTSWCVVLMNKENAQKRFSFDNGIDVGCFDRTRADEIGDDTYFIRKNHIIGNQTDEFIDLSDDILNDARNKTVISMLNQGKEWNKTYPSPKIVREEFRPVTNPLLIIYPLNPICANIKNADGSSKSGTIQYVETDSPFVGFAIAFPNSNVRDNAVTYTVNRVAEYAETEDNFDNEDDNNYDA
ncbi:MAG: Z1 domain-containing protein [Paludibacteraceae bacterium]|nr:Z1 domain-containing protein [Paludibacteraceae bacterium]